MIVSSSQARQILAGRKTQMRVRVQEPREVSRKNGTTYTSVPFTPREGMRVPIAVRRAASDPSEVLGHVIVDRASAGPLGELAKADLLAEGHATIFEFQSWWIAEHDRAWLEATEPVFCPACVCDWNRPDDELPACATCDGEGEIRIVPNREPGEITARFKQRWEREPVHHVRFHLDQSEPVRMLAENGRGDARGYTTVDGNALRDEKPAVDDGLLKVYAIEAHDRDLARKSGVDDDLLASLAGLRAQRRELQRVAVERGIDVRNPLRLIERGQAMIERQIRQQLANAKEAA